MTLHSKARWLRRNSTDAERLLWYHLRAQRAICAHVRRQHPIGPFIVDFVFMKYGLVIELDGGQHQEQSREDAARDASLRALGYRVLRFWHPDVMSRTDEVLEKILNAIQELSPE